MIFNSGERTDKGIVLLGNAVCDVVVGADDNLELGPPFSARTDYHCDSTNPSVLIRAENIGGIIVCGVATADGARALCVGSGFDCLVPIKSFETLKELDTAVAIMQHEIRSMPVGFRLK